MRMAEHPAGMLGELGENRIFLGRQVDLLAVSGDRRGGTGRSSGSRLRSAAGRTPARARPDRRCSGRASRFRSDRRDQLLVRRSGALQLADAARRWPSIAASGPGRSTTAGPSARGRARERRRTRALRPRAGRARARARSGRAGCPAAAADRRRPAAIRRRERGRPRPAPPASERTGWNCHSTVVTPLSPRPVASSGRDDRRGGGDVARGQADRRRLRGEDARLRAGRRAESRCSRRAGQAHCTATSAISRSLVHESSAGQARRWSRCARHAPGQAGPGCASRRQLAGHQRDQEQDDDGDDVVGL